VGTLLVTLFYFWKEIKNVLLALWHKDLYSADCMLILPIIVATIPTALIAVTVGDQLDAYLSSLLYLGIGFIVSGIVSLATGKFWKQRSSGYSQSTAMPWAP
jgi:undecaprenyl pyrophosphate phosphatase UppP